MIIKVTRLWPGDRWELKDPKGYKEFIRAEEWTRLESRKALDLYESVYHYPRKRIRFDVR